MKNFLKSKTAKILILLLAFVIILSGIYASRNTGRVLTTRILAKKDAPAHEAGAKYNVVGNSETDIGSPGNETPMYEPFEPYVEKDVNQKNEKTLKHARISIYVGNENYMSVLQKITDSAKSFGGYVKDANYIENKNKYSGYVLVLIPSEKLESFVQFLKSVGKMQSYQLNSEDKTAEYFDLEGRLKIMKSQRDLLLS